MSIELTASTKDGKVVINRNSILYLGIFFAIRVEPAEAVAVGFYNKNWPMISAEDFVDRQQAMTQATTRVELYFFTTSGKIFCKRSNGLFNFRCVSNVRNLKKLGGDIAFTEHTVQTQVHIFLRGDTNKHNVIADGAIVEKWSH